MKISMIGCSGKMGKAIMEQIVADGKHVLSGGATHAGSDSVGQKLSGITVSADIAKTVADSDVAIDFSRPELSLTALEAAVKHGRPLVIGTTGFTPAQLKKIEEAARKIPILLAANTSLGVNLLAGLVKQAAAALGPEYDIEIVEMHHRHKVDAPSGTALLLGRAAAEGRTVDLKDVAVTDRDGKRHSGAIGFATLRGGDVVGDHTVMFAGDGERVELTHKASSRAVFAKGAIRAAEWLLGAKPGMHSMQDVLFS